MHIELMEPTDKADLTNAVARRLARAGEGFYHLALRVDDVEGTGKTLADKGLTVLERAPVAEGGQASLGGTPQIVERRAGGADLILRGAA